MIAPAQPVPWHYKVRAVLYAIFCFEIGVFLLIFPWHNGWDSNWLSAFSPSQHLLWTNPYFRGAVSGIGLLNIYISLVEVFRLRRFSSHNEDEPA